MFEPGDLIGGYVISRQLGEGGMGTVFEAVRSSDGSRFAIKIPRVGENADMVRFAREVRAMEKLTHPNVVRILECDLEHDPPYFVMPYSEAEALTLVPGNSIEAITIFLGVCEGVRALHKAGVVHRDIKPDNMRLFAGIPAITDLGLAKFAVRDTAVLTATRHVLGTDIYLAPEQRLPGGSRDADERTDVYQLGRSLYQALTGQLPVLMDLGLIDPHLRSIVERSTREGLADRYQSVAHLIDALKGYLASVDPNNDPLPMLKGTISALKEDVRFGRYTPDEVKKVVRLLLNPALLADNDSWLSYFDDIPLEVLGVLSVAVSGNELEQLTRCYREAISAVIRNRSFEYAEEIGRRVEAVALGQTSSPKAVANVLQALLIAAVRLNRFAAMDQFNALLRQIRDEARAVAVAEMLQVNRDEYQIIQDQIQSIELHPILRAART